MNEFPAEKPAEIIGKGVRKFSMGKALVLRCRGEFTVLFLCGSAVTDLKCEMKSICRIK